MAAAEECGYTGQLVHEQNVGLWGMALMKHSFSGSGYAVVSIVLIINSTTFI